MVRSIILRGQNSEIRITSHLSEETMSIVVSIVGPFLHKAAHGMTVFKRMHKCKLLAQLFKRNDSFYSMSRVSNNITSREFGRSGIPRIMECTIIRTNRKPRVGATWLN